MVNRDIIWSIFISVIVVGHSCDDQLIIKLLVTLNSKVIHFILAKVDIVAHILNLTIMVYILAMDANIGGNLSQSNQTSFIARCADTLRLIILIARLWHTRRIGNGVGRHLMLRHIEAKLNPIVSLVNRWVVSDCCLAKSGDFIRLRACKLIVFAQITCRYTTSGDLVHIVII